MRTTASVWAAILLLFVSLWFKRHWCSRLIHSETHQLPRTKSRKTRQVFPTDSPVSRKIGRGRRSRSHRRGLQAFRQTRFFSFPIYGPNDPSKNPGSGAPPAAPTAGISNITSSAKPSPFISATRFQSPGCPFGTNSWGWSNGALW